MVLCVLILFVTACSNGGEQQRSATTASTIRSSGALAYVDSDTEGPIGPLAVDPDASGLGADETEDVLQEAQDNEDGALDQLPPVNRPDGIELVFDDGRLASIEPRSTIEEIGAALGPLYLVAEEEFIRVGFPSGYSISKGGEVLLWAIEERGRITTLMTTNEKVGLDSGLRPGLAFDDAIALHGEPTLTIGDELREFVSFSDGTGFDDGVQVLVAIGQFGGPVGVYPGGVDLGNETSEYLLVNAKIKELWFPLV